MRKKRPLLIFFIISTIIHLSLLVLPFNVGPSRERTVPPKIEKGVMKVQLLKAKKEEIPRISMSEKEKRRVSEERLKSNLQELEKKKLEHKKEEEFNKELKKAMEVLIESYEKRMGVKGVALIALVLISLVVQLLLWSMVLVLRILSYKRTKRFIEEMKPFLYELIRRFAYVFSKGEFDISKNYYGILEVDKEADTRAIRTAFRGLAKRWHPDKNPDNKQKVTEMIKEIIEAYKVLSNPKLRKEYDTLSPYGRFGSVKDTGSQPPSEILPLQPGRKKT